MIYLFHCIDFCTDNVEAMVGKTAGALMGIKAMGPNGTSSH